VLNAPHPAAMNDALRHNPRQLVRSWYLFAFQIPALPEALFRANGFRGAQELLVRTSRPGTFPPDKLRHYRRAWAQPKALASMLNWYRAAARAGGDAAALTRSVAVPALLVWGAEDAALVPELAAASIAYCPQGRLARLPEAGHWVQAEAPAAVNRLLLDWLAAPPHTSASPPAGSP